MQVLCTVTGFIGIGWDWDIVLVELSMQATNFGIAACLHFRRQLLRHSRSKEGVAALVVSNVILRGAVFNMFLEMALAPVGSDDGECKEMAVRSLLRHPLRLPV